MKMNDFHLPLIYNLFPRLVRIEHWPLHAAHAASMKFNWFYINPINCPGLSGSLYATKHYGRLNPAFVPSCIQDDTLDVVKPTIRQIAESGVHPMIDLVINHVAVDSPLVQENPQWFFREKDGSIRHPCAVDPDDSSKKTIWGDLAEIDNEHSPDRERLWAFWGRLVKQYLDLGFEGFRCDAAYQVPADLWRYLMDVAYQANPKTIFWAENLGCTVLQTRALRLAGFQFFCNSSKWWNFEDGWCLDQHREFEDLQSVSFPETHDTDRLAAETGSAEAIQRLRYAFAAIFSAGVMMPIGYEFGFQKRLDVVTTQPSDWEEPSFDLCDFVTAVNSLKRTCSLLHGEGSFRRIPIYQADLLVLERTSIQAPDRVGWVIVNKHPHHAQFFSVSQVIEGRANIQLFDVTRCEQYPDGQCCPSDVQVPPSAVFLLLLQE